MTDQAGDPGGLRDQARKVDESIGQLRDALWREPDRRLGYHLTEEARQMLRSRAGEFTLLKGEILEAAAEEEELDLAGLAQVASKPGEKPMTRQRVHTLISQAREARADRHREETTG